MLTSKMVLTLFTWIVCLSWAWYIHWDQPSAHCILPCVLSYQCHPCPSSYRLQWVYLSSELQYAPLHCYLTRLMINETLIYVWDPWQLSNYFKSHPAHSDFFQQNTFFIQIIRLICWLCLTYPHSGSCSRLLSSQGSWGCR